jgi:hypothetical protein
MQVGICWTVIVCLHGCLADQEGREGAGVKALWHNIKMQRGVRWSVIVCLRG